jgi:3-hydroxyisobutyrate dehydrogenase-like beta-hydroxyacid dehydrogenase
VKVAFIGMGTMGAPMALNLLKAGHGVIPSTIAPAIAKFPLQRRAQNGPTLRLQRLQAAEVVITCVSDTADVEQVILGENGVMAGGQAGHSSGGHVNH